MATSAGLVQAHRCRVQADELITISLQTQAGNCSEATTAVDVLSRGGSVTVREDDMATLRRLLAAQGGRA